MLAKAREWHRSKHLNLHEELLGECGVPLGIRILIDIMERHPKREWCRRYTETTGKTDRTYRRHKPLAEQVIACRKSRDDCPIVRLAPAQPPVNGDGQDDGGQSDTPRLMFGS